MSAHLYMITVKDPAGHRVSCMREPAPNAWYYGVYEEPGSGEVERGPQMQWVLPTSSLGFAQFYDDEGNPQVVDGYDYLEAI